MNKKNFIILTFILIIALFLRLIGLDKPEGLWNDEYVSWFIASKGLFGDFISEMVKNCHMPIYYLYLKSWMFLFSDTDYSLRLSSVFLGILSVLSMYFVGKEFKDEKLGLYCAGYTALSGFLIYFSQEVRLYSLLFFITSVCLLFSIRLIKEQSNFNFVLWILFNLLIALTHSIGFIFVILNVAGVALYLYKKDKKLLKPILIGLSVIIVLMIPLVPFLYKIFTASYISQFWSSFTLSKIFFVFADYFSPIQINVITSPKSILSIIYNKQKFNYLYIIFALIPAFVSFIGLITAFFQKDRLIKYLSVICTLYFSVLVTASCLNKLVLITKYSIEIYPVLILLVCFGLYSIKKNFIRNFFICILVIFPLFFYIVNKNSTPKLGRTEGNRIVIELLKAGRVQNRDTVLLTYYNTERFDKYASNTKFKTIYIDKFNFNYFITHNKYSHYDAVLKGKELYAEQFKNNDNKDFNEILLNEFISKLNKGDKFALVFLKTVSFLDGKTLKEISNNPEEYKKIPLLFLVFSYIKNNTVEICNKNLKLELILDSGDWELYVYRKQ